MQVVEAPNHHPDPYVNSLFLAGGITGCGDWQKQAIRLLSHSNLLLFNPRRGNFDITDQTMEREQIEWEAQYLSRCHTILFWFPKATLCPITLYELGRWIGSTKPIFLGCDPDYARRRDLEIQTRLVRPNFPIRYSLESLCDEVLRQTGNFVTGIRGSR